jgi:hypothetical protein
VLEAVLLDLFPRSLRARVGVPAALATLAALAVLTLACVLRQIGAPALDTLWAEDAAIFLSTAYITPLADAVNQTYAGYVHWLPRIAAAATVNLVPVSHVALSMALAGAFFTASAGVLVYIATAGHIRFVPLRATLGALVVLAPVMSFEMLNAMTPLQWQLTFACFWLALWRPSRVSAAVLSAVVVFLTVASAPPAMALAPLFLARLLLLLRARPHDRLRDLLPTVGFGAGVAVQLTHLSPGEPPGVAGSGTLSQLGEAWATFVAAPALFGFQPITYTAVTHPGLTGKLLAAAVVFWVLVVAVALAACRRHRLTVLVTALLAVTVPSIGFWLRGDAVGALGFRELFPNTLPLSTRYGIVGCLLLASILVLAADAIQQPYLQTAVIAGLALAAGVGMFEPNLRTPGPTLSSQLPAAARACASGQYLAEIAATPWLVGLPEPTWRLWVPCDQIPESSP